MVEQDMSIFNKGDWDEGNSRLSKYEQRDWWLKQRQWWHAYFFTLEGPASLITSNEFEVNQPGDIIRICIRERLLVEELGLVEYYEHIETEGPRRFIKKD